MDGQRFRDAVECNRDMVFRVAYTYLRNWLVRVTVNECRSLFRRPWRRVEDIEAYANQLQMPSEGHVRVFTAVMRLPERYRVPLVLHYYGGFSTGGVAYAVATAASSSASLATTDWGSAPSGASQHRAARPTGSRESSPTRRARAWSRTLRLRWRRSASSCSRRRRSGHGAAAFVEQDDERARLGGVLLGKVRAKVGAAAFRAGQHRGDERPSGEDRVCGVD